MWNHDVKFIVFAWLIGIVSVLLVDGMLRLALPITKIPFAKREMLQQDRLRILRRSLLLTIVLVPLIPLITRTASFLHL